jgi:hypothetical protein
MGVLRPMCPAAEEYFSWLIPACCRALGGVAELGDQDEAAGERPAFQQAVRLS